MQHQDLEGFQCESSSSLSRQHEGQTLTSPSCPSLSVDVFNTLPIASIVASKIFCVHGGLSPSLSSMDDIRRIQRPTDVPDYGLLNDLLWSDPSDTAFNWEDNERGVSYCFGKSVVRSHPRRLAP